MNITLSDPFEDKGANVEALGITGYVRNYYQRDRLNAAIDEAIRVPGVTPTGFTVELNPDVAAELKALQALVLSLRRDNNAQADRLAEADSDAAHYRQEMNARTVMVKELRAELALARDDVRALDERVNELQSKLREAQGIIDAALNPA